MRINVERTTRISHRKKYLPHSSVHSSQPHNLPVRTYAHNWAINVHSKELHTCFQTHILSPLAHRLLFYFLFICLTGNKEIAGEGTTNRERVDTCLAGF